ncbi:ABC transporter ATP-binding protein [Alteromonas sp. LMIT006]|uniref:ATP-binding cassette ATPase Uup n=1 Tax=Alteromonadaceae TaxID=72275 RepID=UPI0020CA343C|nr:ABC transporter ATP-binding protein [Alteromonas sp. LMIT006]UTP72114.1 ABC transporter ATP-binding protein [Alteromonas sp. LMIT006]
MSVFQIRQGTVIYGQPPLLDGIDLVLESKERVCIVGRNGSGKSTLMKVIAGEVILDDGQRVVENGISIARLPQDPPESVEMTLFDYVAEGLAEVGKLLQAYHEQSNLVAQDPSEQNIQRLTQFQEQLDTHNAWQFENAIAATLSLLKLPAEVSLSTLSGGWRRKAALARALVTKPDILLLDEPTNHLDIAMVKWLEQSLTQYQGCIVFISHDRAFIRSMATRIVDLDRGQLTSYPGDYATYLDKKAHDLAVEEEHNAQFDKKLAQEEVWIRQGIKARRTRNEGRVRALKKLREQHSARRKVQGSAKIASQSVAPSGKRVFEVEGLHYQIEGKTIVNDLNLYIARGDKIAFIGDNGCGKSTLIRLLLGEIKPDSGSIIQGANLEIAYFDQHREALDLNATVADCVADGKQEVMVNGRPRHIISYLQDYLFTPDRIKAPVSALSGGEKNRVLLAKLMLKPSNLLILDEPTNDLDVETLELLESLLVDYEGSVILVSHDREFIDNVVTSSLVFEGDGRLSEFVGGYSAAHSWYAEQDKKASERSASGTNVTGQSPKSQTKSVTKTSNKLSYKDRRELEQLPSTIERLEAELQTLETQINSSDFFAQTPADQQPVFTALSECQAQLDTAYERWDELEALQEQISGS